jgi:hypothetical protein
MHPSEKGKDARWRSGKRAPASNDFPERRTGAEHFLQSDVKSPSSNHSETTMGRGLLLWLIGVPIPVIVLLWLFFGR